MNEEGILKDCRYPDGGGLFLLVIARPALVSKQSF